MAPGHRVFDEAGIVEQPSPFQPRVYCILDLKQFLRCSRTVEQFKAATFWLPTWHDMRALLRSMAVTDESVVEALQHDQYVESGSELLTLYRLLSAHIMKRPVGA